MQENPNPTENLGATGFPEDMPMPEGFTPELPPVDFPAVEYAEDDQPKSKKAVAVAVIGGLIVLAAAIWGIVSIVNNVGSRNTTAENPVQIGEVAPTTDSTINQKPAVSPSDQYTAEENKTEDTPKPATNTNNNNADSTDKVVNEPVTPVASTPETGPADVALTAVLMGIATTLALYNLTAKRSAKHEA